MSKHGAAIDHLFNLIFILTGIIFIGTGLVLGWTLWRFGEDKNQKPVKYTHGSRSLEITWSIIPGIILIFLSVYQMEVWAERKMERPMRQTASAAVEPVPPLCRVIARQFGWTFQYAGKDEQLDTHDDFYSISELCVPTDKQIVLQIESEDVLHSFFIPRMRIKQDVVPGMVQYCWFVATKTGKADIMCTELCGWGHYKMKAELTVLSQEDFEKWLANKTSSELADEFDPEAELENAESNNGV